jgi:adenosylhomocysteine nucleosidase
VNVLVVIPTDNEFTVFVETCLERQLRAEHSILGRLPVTRFPDLGLVVSRGGLGKIQFAVQTQHLLDATSDWCQVICAGAAGALVETVAIGDVVIGTETVEHDIRKVGTPLIPRFRPAETTLAHLRLLTPKIGSFRVHHGPIASGDEDVMDLKRREELHELTGGLAVAWEGAGAAKACQFSNTPFIEIRGIADRADTAAASDFRANLGLAMRNVATLVAEVVPHLRTQG